MKRITSLLLALIISLSVPFFASATGQQTSDVPDEHISITVSAQNNGEFILPKTVVYLPKNYADHFGFEADGNFSAFDALVAVHSLTENEFTPDTVGDYLDFSQSGYLSKIFGIETSGFGFCVNGGQPNDGVLVESDYENYYTGYTISQAVLEDGDDVEFYFYLDDYAMDYYTYFTSEGERIGELHAEIDEEIVLGLEGYCIGWYGCNQNIEDTILPMSEAIIYIDMNDGEGLVPYNFTDENGNVTLTFSEDGVYTVSALHDTTDETAIPIIMPWLEITVGDVVREETPVTPEVPQPKLPIPDDGEILAVFEVPENAELFVGAKPKDEKNKEVHYKDFLEVSPELVNDGKYYFILTEGATYNYRVSGNNILTVASKFKAVIEEGEEQLIITINADDLSGNKKEVFRNDGYYEANLLTNVGADGVLSMEKGESFSLVAMRAWQAVDNITGNYFFEPDFHYEVFGNEGGIEITKDGVITAKQDGAYFVTVTYDSFFANGHLYSAIYPENTGVFVVTVGDGFEESFITVDSELHSVYYLKDDGEAEFSFTLPEDYENAKIVVVSPTITETGADYGEFQFSDENVTISDGTATVSLTKGRNILKIEKDESISYHVVTARPIEYTIQKLDNAVQEDSDENSNKDTICEGDTVAVSISGLSAPVPKLAGVYNFSNRISFFDEFDTEIKGNAAQYNFIQNGNTIEVTIPDGAFDDGAYRLDGGYITVSGWGDPIGDGHRSITREVGKNPNFTAVKNEAKLCTFPAIIITPDGVSKITPVESLSVKQNPEKLTYNVGDEFDSSGLILEYTDINGIISEISEGYEISPNGKLKRSDKKVTVTYNGLSVEIPVSVTSNSSSAKNISVKVAVRGDYIHGSDEHEGKYPVWIKSTTVKVPKGSSAFDAIEKALSSKGYVQSGGEDGYISEVTTPDGVTLGEFDNGDGSGWMYTVNNKLLEVGILDYILKSGDKIALFFTDDFNELWDNAWNSSSGRGGAITVVIGQSGKTENADKADSEKDNSDEEKSDEKSKENDEEDTSENKNSDNKQSEDIKLPFEDVTEQAWYYEYIAKMYAGGNLPDIYGQSFMPDEAISRGEIVSILSCVLKADTKNVSDVPAFSDVSSTHAFHSAIQWAFENGKIKGVGAGRFSPDASIKRCDAALMLFRAFGFEATDATLSFADNSDIPEYSLEAVKTLCSLGIMCGNNDNTFAPSRSISRAEICKMLILCSEVSNKAAETSNHDK